MSDVPHDLLRARAAADRGWKLEPGAQRDFAYGQAIQNLVAVAERHEKWLAALAAQAAETEERTHA